MTAKHTPGPWEIDSDYVQQAGQTSVAICDVMCIDEGGNNGWYRGPITQANAHLISAAPDLLEALIAMEQEKSDYMTRNALGDPSVETTNKMARAAIAKAKGQS